MVGNPFWVGIETGPKKKKKRRKSPTEKVFLAPKATVAQELERVGRGPEGGDRVTRCEGSDATV